MREYKSVRFMSSEDKALVIRDWDRFLRRLLKDNGEMGIDRHGNRVPGLFSAFTKMLYDHLIQHCSFIAHYDRFGFFCSYFSEPEKTIKFLGQFNPRYEMRSVEYGSRGWLAGDYEDVNNEMCVVAGRYIEEIYVKLNSAQKSVDVERADALLAKHGIRR